MRLCDLCRGSLETLEEVDAVVVDKSGTLTEGKPKLTSIIPLNAANQVRSRSLPPASNNQANTRWRALPQRVGENRGIAVLPAAEFRSIAGQGIVGTESGRIVAAANEAPPQRVLID